MRYAAFADVDVSLTCVSCSAWGMRQRTSLSGQSATTRAGASSRTVTAKTASTVRVAMVVSAQIWFADLIIAREGAQPLGCTGRGPDRDENK